MPLPCIPAAYNISGTFDTFTGYMSTPDVAKSTPQILYLFTGLQNKVADVEFFSPWVSRSPQQPPHRSACLSSFRFST